MTPRPDGTRTDDRAHWDRCLSWRHGPWPVSRRGGVGLLQAGAVIRVVPVAVGPSPATAGD
ncbi:hypothetical protein M2164_005183 [Streptomyces sp. SAI-208]|nr:hypothetical protein [Streptomyces sp. SAI-117]MDH6585042.1 hypothetical protein [Streptomyces sp. SAI-133]MDH6609548.1 hypothetical protein [Streptomyces sp. SAI-208]